MELPEGYWFFVAIILGMVGVVYLIHYLLSLIGLNIDKTLLLIKY